MVMRLKIGVGFTLLLFVLANGGASALATPVGHITAGTATGNREPTLAPARNPSLPAAPRSMFYQALAENAGKPYNVNKAGCATLPKVKFQACFSRWGAHFTGGGAPLALRLLAWGREGHFNVVDAVKPAIAGDQVRYAHGNLTEWWRVLPVGFDQGFTIAKRPVGHGDLTLTLAMSREGAGIPPVPHSRSPVRSTQIGEAGNPAGSALAWGRLRYGQLVVTDARGKIIPATLQVASKLRGTQGQEERILIAINDAHAIYPLTVDPLVWLEQKATAADGAQDDQFGYSVAVSGMTALVGAPYAFVNGNYGGAAYVFSESGGIWTQTAELTASDGGGGFGGSTALSGTTALIGAPTHNGGPGAAYVFSESGGTWTQTAELTASDGAMHGCFGASVAFSGTTALIGAYGCYLNQGAAYVFNKVNGAWAQTAELTASDGATLDEFGYSAALSDRTALIGAPAHNGYQGAAYVFSEANGAWAQTAELAASDGAAFDSFGWSVALDGTTALIGSHNLIGDRGAAYVFDEANGVWTQTAELTASDGAAYDYFGWSVALDGPTAVIGAPAHNGVRGAAYMFNETNDIWTQTAELAASDGAPGDWFGWLVALDGPIMLIGASYATVNGIPAQGAAYFYGKSDLGFVMSAPQEVPFGKTYVSQTIVTNAASAASPAVTATITVPAATSFVSATASQGKCSEDSDVVICNFGAIPGNTGTATANVTLKAAKNTLGTTLENTASVAYATPELTAGAATVIGCPAGYTEYDGSLVSGERTASPPYTAPAGMENGILISPPRFSLFAAWWNPDTGQWQVYGANEGNEIHHPGPGSGQYRWIAQAWAESGGAYSLCVLHP